MPQTGYRVASLGPVIKGIERRQARLRNIRPRVAQEDLPSLDLRLQALEQSRIALSGRCKVHMTAFFARRKGAPKK
jgi:hypothetical protein